MAENTTSVAVGTACVNTVTYEEKFEYILDHGLECRCCPLHRECNGKVKQTPSGPVLPACGEHDYKDLLIREKVNQVYREEHSK